MKNVTDFRKTVETGVDPHLITFRDCHMHINFFPTTFLEIAVYGSTYPPSHRVIPYALTTL